MEIHYNNGKEIVEGGTEYILGELDKKYNIYQTLNIFDSRYEIFSVNFIKFKTKNLKFSSYINIPRNIEYLDQVHSTIHDTITRINKEFVVGNFDKSTIESDINQLLRMK